MIGNDPLDAYRVAPLMRYLQQMPSQEIAAILETTEAAKDLIIRRHAFLVVRGKRTTPHIQ